MIRTCRKLQQLVSVPAYLSYIETNFTNSSIEWWIHSSSDHWRYSFANLRKEYSVHPPSVYLFVSLWKMTYPSSWKSWKNCSVILVNPWTSTRICRMFWSRISLCADHSHPSQSILKMSIIRPVWPRSVVLSGMLRKRRPSSFFPTRRGGPELDWKPHAW